MSYKSKYFSDPVSLAQIKCHCGCQKTDLSEDLYRILDKLRERLGCPININSGLRCEKHDLNIYLGKLEKKHKAGLLSYEDYRQADLDERVKKRTSSHIKGLAVDIAVNDLRERFEVLRDVFAFNCCNANRPSADAISEIKRIGIAKNFIHIDIDPGKTQDVVWIY